MIDIGNKYPQTSTKSKQKGCRLHRTICALYDSGERWSSILKSSKINTFREKTFFSRLINGKMIMFVSQYPNNSTKTKYKKRKRYLPLSDVYTYKHLNILLKNKRVGMWSLTFIFIYCFVLIFTSVECRYWKQGS